jgi:tRNA/tmRNA/rRNA uracil-C5-methylase (TrmA/RlmC/RlmD family)
VYPALADCPHRPPCPGCPRWGEDGVAPDARRALAELARDAGLPDPPLFSGPRTGFRTRARLAVRGRPGAPKLGIFQAGSHRIADIPNCAVHHPRINEAAGIFKVLLREARLAPYVEANGRGLVRYLQVAVERASGRSQLVIVTHAAQADPIRPLAERLRAELGERLAGLWWNGNESPHNAILGPHWEHLAGDAMLRESIAGTPVFFPPGAFAQSNLDLAERLAARVRECVPRGARVAEFYAGTGAIGLGLLEHCASLELNEVEPQALEGLRAGLDARPDGLRDRARVLAGRAGDHTAALARADLAIADPPRKGLDPELLAALRARPAGTFLYLSCGLPAFLRECADLREAGWRLAALEIWDFFPHTAHVETFARFEAGS